MNRLVAAIAAMLLTGVCLAQAAPPAPAPATAPAPADATAAPSPAAAPDCGQLLTRATQADLRAASAQAQNRDLDSLVPLVEAVIAAWSQAAEHCTGRSQELARRNLAFSQKQRAALAERQSSGSQCDSLQRDATQLQDLARQALAERRFADSAGLYGKAETMWDLAAENCAGSQKERALRGREQSATDGHNAEFCAPVFERSREFVQKLRSAAGELTPEERQRRLQAAETLWREAANRCRGNAADTARSNAQALARERGTPWVYTPAQRVAEAGAGASPQAPSAAAAATPAAKGASPELAAAPAVKPPIAPAAPSAAPALPAAPAAAPPAAPAIASALPAGEPQQVDTLLGTTRFRGRFVMEDGRGLTGEGRIEWSHGDAYEGQVRLSLPEGEGEFVWASGQRYKGPWVAGRASGRGRMQFANGNVFEGDVLDGQPQGEGVMNYASGDRYRGQVRNGVPNGRGRYDWLNGQRYEGEWRDDKPHGRGVLRFPDGGTYEGPFVSGVATGTGRFVYASGDIYEGGVAQGKPDGRGVYQWKAGDRYEGLWQQGRKHGQGRFTWANGNVWEGRFEDDHPTDDGTLTLKEK
jgi:hypothetical protein